MRTRGEAKGKASKKRESFSKERKANKPLEKASQINFHPEGNRNGKFAEL
jgi:hypothetical protein